MPLRQVERLWKTRGRTRLAEPMLTGVPIRAGHLPHAAERDHPDAYYAVPELAMAVDERVPSAGCLQDLAIGLRT